MKKPLFVVVIYVLSSCDAFFFEDANSSDVVHTYEVFYQELDDHFAFFPYLDRDFDSAYQVGLTELQSSPNIIQFRVHANDCRLFGGWPH